MRTARLATVVAVLALAAPAAAAPGRLVLERPGVAPPEPAAAARLRLVPDLHARLAVYHGDPAPKGRGQAAVPTRFARDDLALERPSGRSGLEALAWFLGRDEAPFPLDDGGGARAGEDQVIGFLLGFFPGFGLGHLILDDEDGFLFYLLVDFVTVAALVVVDVLFPTVWAITVLGWIGLHVLQGIDAYRTAGGGGRFRADRGPPGLAGRELARPAGGHAPPAFASLVELQF